MIIFRPNEYHLEIINDERLTDWVTFLQEHYWNKILLIDYVPNKYIMYFTYSEFAQNRKLIICTES